MKDRLDKIAAYAKAMADLYFSADQKLAILGSVNTPEVAGLLDRSYGAHAYRALMLTLLIDSTRDMWAFILDRRDDAPSLCNIVRVLGADDLRAALRAKNTEPLEAIWLDNDLPPDMRARLDRQFEAQDRAEREQRFDDAYARLVDGVPGLLGSANAQAIDKARKKAIAHYEIQADGDAGFRLFDPSDVHLKWGDPARFLADAEPLIFDVVLLATNGSYDIDGFKKANRLYAADFWSRLMGKGVVDEAAS